MIKFCLLAFSILAVTSGCGMSVGPGEGSSDQNIGNGIGSLSYEFKINRTCSGSCKPDDIESCSVKKQFASSYLYCEGLRDAELNKGCARRERKALYLRDCSRTFEDKKIPGWGLYCGSEATDKSSYTTYPRKRDLCDDVTDDRRHGSCSASLRRELAARYECSINN